MTHSDSPIGGRRFVMRRRATARSTGASVSLVWRSHRHAALMAEATNPLHRSARSGPSVSLRNSRT
jgi:hypothetical protein